MCVAGVFVEDVDDGGAKAAPAGPSDWDAEPPGRSPCPSQSRDSGLGAVAAAARTDIVWLPSLMWLLAEEEKLELCVRAAGAVTTRKKRGYELKVWWKVWRQWWGCRGGDGCVEGTMPH